MQGLDGLLKCYIHNVSFNEPSEYYEHEREEEHGHTGAIVCSDCGHSFQIDEKNQPSGKLKPKELVPSFRCPDCQEIEEQKIIEKLQKEGKIKKK